MVPRCCGGLYAAPLSTAQRVHDGEVLTLALAAGAAAVYVPPSANDCTAPSASNRRLTLMHPLQQVHQRCAVKTIKKRENQKPWLTRDICSPPRTWTAAFRPGEPAACRLLKNNHINCEPTPPSWGREAFASVNPKCQTD